MKICSICKEEKPLSEFYSRETSNKKQGNYTYYLPYCKRCSSKKSHQWQKDNKERYDEYLRNKVPTEYRKQKKRLYSKIWREKGYNKEYQLKNKDKISKYNTSRQNKNHNISKEEWLTCREYFDFECAYCGIKEDIHKELFKQGLHKEHVIHDGKGDLSNCVPSCKRCNSQKWEFLLEDWYNDKNENFTQERLDKILQWLEVDYKKI